MDFPKTLEERFKKNMLNVAELLSDYILDAAENHIIDVQVIRIQSIFEAFRKLVTIESSQSLIENFIKFSKSDEDRNGTNPNRYPEYWNILSKLPSPSEIKQEENLDDSECKPLAPEVEEFLLYRMRYIFPIADQVHDIIHKMYHHCYADGEPFLSILDKKHLTSFFRSFPILIIKYINARRKPVLENGTLVINQEKQTIQYHKDGERYYPDISIKNSMRLFGLSYDNLLE